MRILIDAFWWEVGPPSGQLVLKNLVHYWGEFFKDDELILAIPSVAKTEIESSKDENFLSVETKCRIHPIINALELPRIAKRIGGIDGIFAQNFSPLSGRSVVFIHDVLFQSNPEWFTLRERVYLSTIPIMALKATSILTSSGNESERIRSHNPRLQDVSSTGLSVSRSLIATNPTEPSGTLRDFEFTLTVGRINQRKNLQATLLAALRSGVLSPESPIVVVGEKSGRVEQFGQEISQAEAEGKIRFLGYVSDSELRWLYERCRLFCYLSLDEGYGLTPLEAKYFGAPCLVSDIPVFRETMDGRNTQFVDPKDFGKISIEFATSFCKSNRQADNSARAEALAPDDVEAAWRVAVSKIRTSFSQAIGSPQ